MKMDFLKEVYEKRKKLADLLADEEYSGIREIVEELYPDKAHFIYELLQNAEDTGARQAIFSLSQQGLTFEHDGERHFSEDDVWSITNIGKSTKQNELDQIGKFGVGFKAVFAYTETPHIYSKRFCFQITQLVLPEAITPKPEVGEKTHFKFPFNNPKKLAKAAFSEIKAGLEALSETALLFLSSLLEIHWRIDGSEGGSISRIEHIENHIEVRKVSRSGTVSSTHWLRFTVPVNGLLKQNVAIAYELELLPGIAAFEPEQPLTKQMKIIPSQQGTVSVFFPAEKESSGLRFHLHAPFVPELSRASIKNTEVNLPLFEQLATLAAQSLHTIRDLRLLTGEFLGVLPNPDDPLPVHYRCIRQAIIDEMINQPLTPAQDKGHAPAWQLIQSKAIFKELIDESDLQYLLGWGEKQPKWSVNAQQRNSNQDKFLAGLNIYKWDLRNFLETLQKNVSVWVKPLDTAFTDWLSAKSHEWHQQMYAVFYKELEKKDFPQLKNLKIVRLSDGSYSVGPQCYFPSEGRAYGELMPRVAHAVFSSGSNETQQMEARSFLEAVGVREIGEAEEIEQILKERYGPASHRPDDKTYKVDLERFMSFIENNPPRQVPFWSSFIFKTEYEKWAKPSDIFLDLPYKETFLSAYYERVPQVEKRKSALSPWYKEAGITPERLGAFAEMVGAETKLPIKEISTGEHRDVRSLRQDRYRHRRRVRWTDSAIDEDWTINGLSIMLDTPSLKLSQLIWKTLRDHEEKRPSILWARFRPNSQCEIRESHSTLAYLLREKDWIPQKDGTFVKPAQASRSQLPKGFPFDEGWKWLKAIEFGEDEKNQSEEFQQREVKRIGLGFKSQDDLERALEFVELPVEEQQRILSEYVQRRDFELPENTPSQRRGEKVSEQAKDAPERISEERTRSVSVGLEDVKAKAGEYLHQQYTKLDGQMICQVCKAELPFKKNDGDYYFECVEFLADLPAHHYQNYLALCPNHAAMFQYANGSKELLWEMFTELKETELEVILAQRDMTIYFTKMHITDLTELSKINVHISDSCTIMSI
jgi:hypothetical protein